MTPERLSAGAREELVEEVFLAYLQAVDRGQTPDPAALVDGHPEIAEELRALFADEARLQPLLAPLRVRLPASADTAASGLAGDARETPGGAGEGRPDGKGPVGTASCHAEATGDRPGGEEREALPDIPGFVVLAVLGQGGMGVVYKVFDRGLKRFGALKMVRPDRPVRAEALARLRAEAEALARLPHRHIVQVFASGEHEGRPYFVQEFVEGGSLDRKVRGRPQEPREAARLVRLLARAVHAAHGCGIVHRDLKPANVLLAPPSDEPALNTAYGCPKVADFGLAKYLDGTQAQTATGVGVGTPLYMAPEQTRGDLGAVGPATDVWALGAMLYELLTGQVPFQGSSALETLEQIRSRAPEPPRRLRCEVPPELEAICLRCLEKSPSDRYPSAAALAEDLHRWLEGRADLQAYPEPKGGSWRWLAVAAVALLVAGGLTAWLLGRNGKDGGLPGGTGPAGVKVAGKETPLKGYLDVRVTEEGNPRREGLLLHQPGALPLRPGDVMDYEVKVNRPAYLYLVYLDSKGGATPLFPWKNYDWKQRPKEERRSQLFDKGPLAPSPAGIEALLLLVREEPLPGDVDMPKLFAGLPQQQGLPDQRARAWFENGELVRHDPDRGPPVLIGQGDPREDVVLQTQALLRDRLRPLFPYTRAVCFAFQGD
jgi:hypothetical protein